MSISQKQQQPGVWVWVNSEAGCREEIFLGSPFCEAEADGPVIAECTSAAKIVSANSSPGGRPPLSGKGREPGRWQ